MQDSLPKTWASTGLPLIGCHVALRYSVNILTRATPSWWSCPCRFWARVKMCNVVCAMRAQVWIGMNWRGFSTQLSTCMRHFEAFWGLATMLFLLLGAWLSTPGSGFLGGVSLELRDEEGHWVFFSGPLGPLGPWIQIDSSVEKAQRSRAREAHWRA